MKNISNKKSTSSSLTTKILSILFIFFFGVSNAQDGGILFNVGPNMAREKMASVASRLSNGKVVALTGRDIQFVSSRYSDLYDPSTNTFSETQMGFVHDQSGVAKLSNGKYLIFGGCKDLGVPAYTTSEIYDPASNTFTQIADLLKPRMHAGAAELKNGNILVVGGWYDPVAAAQPEVYVTATGTFSLPSNLNIPRAYPFVLPTNDSGAIIVGGWPTYGGNNIPTVEYYSSTTNGFTTISNELIPSDSGWIPYSHFFIFTKTIEDCKMSNGNYLVIAGKGTETALVEFNPSTKAFSLINTNKPLRDSLTDGGFFAFELNNADHLLYMFGIDSGYTTQQHVSLVTVDLSNGNVYHPTTTLVLPANEYIGSQTAFTYLPDSNKILVQGITSEYDNFSATSKTYLWKPTMIPLGIDAKELHKQTMIYPNPISDQLNVSIQTNSNAGVQISLSDITGALIWQKQMTLHSGANQLTHSMKEINNGIYFLRISNNELNETHKIIISK